MIPLPYEVNQWNTQRRFERMGASARLVRQQRTSIWAYWGNPAATIPPSYTTNGSVWQPQYMLVWHLEQSGFPYEDSTGLYPALSGVAPGVTTGEIGLGGLFNGTSSYLNAGTVNVGTAFTLFAWIKMSSSANNIQTIWANGPTDWNSLRFFIIRQYV